MNVTDLLGLPRVDEDLARLEASLRLSVRVEDPFLAEVARHLIDAGGKRLRPALAIAAASVRGAEPTQDVLLGGVAVELVHMASLYHDDVMDEAVHRRTVASVNARWGNLVAVVAGDFLLARAAEVAASLGTEVAGLLAATLGRMCEGQVAEVHAMFQTSRTQSSYLTAIAGKTASLMSCACRIGGITAGLTHSERDAVTVFGESLGMVFQIRDDILDVVASDHELGKEAGQDLAKGIYTLPVLHALADPDVGHDLRALLRGPLEGAQREAARLLVAGSDGVGAAGRTARQWAERAAQAASSLCPGPVADALVQLPFALLDDLPVAA